MFTILREAQAEIREACAFLDGQSSGLAVRYYDALVQCFDRIAAIPLSYAQLDHSYSGLQYRRALVPDFRYAVIFTADERDVVIVAVMHTSRAPDYWFGRSSV